MGMEFIHLSFTILFRKVLFEKSDKQQFKHIEKYREQLQKDKRTIRFDDYGAGSKLVSGQSRKISEIANSSSTRKKVW
jgi:hypothetical protein